MARAKNWTNEEYELLRDLWGESSIPTIAKRLNRSVAAVKIKASKLKLGAHRQRGGLISFLELLRAIGQEHNYSYLKMRLPRDGFPMKYKRVEKNKFLMVCIDDFWKWAEENKDDINFANFEINALGLEPSWVADKRKADYTASKFTKEPWSQADDDRLMRMLNTFKYGYAEISIKLRRTEGAVKRRIINLGLKQRPVKASPRFWTDLEIKTLLDLRKKGCGYEEIGQKLNRSACACRGRVERLENPDYFVRYRHEKRQMGGAI